MIDYKELKLKASHAVGFSDMSIAPDMILELIAEIERLETAHAVAERRYHEQIDARDQIATNYNKLSYGAEICREERDQLRAELAGLRTGFDAQNEVIAGLKKDADKWKTVQSAIDQLLADEGRAAIWSACSRVLISVANELNSGRSVVTEEGVTSDGVEIGDWRVTVERIDAAMGKGGEA